MRESEKLKTALELYDLETHQKKLGPDYHRLKTVVKKTIEQEIRHKNFGMEIMRRTRGQESFFFLTLLKHNSNTPSQRKAR